MSEIGLRVMSSNLVSNDEIKDAKNKEIELARKDGKNNVVLVNKLENGDAVISRLDVDDIANISVGTAFESGHIKGQIVFFDDGKDDIISKNQENQKITTTVPIENKKDSMYKLSAEQAYKLSVVFEAAQDAIHNGSIPAHVKNISLAKSENTSTREKIDAFKSFQEDWLFLDDKKRDGVFDTETFIAMKKEYSNNGKDPYTSDSEFRNLIDDAIKVFDKGMTFENFLKKWDMEYKAR